METKICEHCGEVFQFSKYTLQTRRAYARHVQLHDHNCKICGESFPNGTQRKFHERSHKEHSVKCPQENCHYVGSSQQAVDTHVKHAHSTLGMDSNKMSIKRIFGHIFLYKALSRKLKKTF